MTRYEDLTRAYREHMDSYCVIVDKPVCPLCAKEHRICRFAAGSLSCVDAWCTNPHHRAPKRRKKKANVAAA